jgi:hypothetical protein
MRLTADRLRETDSSQVFGVTLEVQSYQESFK